MSIALKKILAVATSLFVFFSPIVDLVSYADESLPTKQPPVVRTMSETEVSGEYIIYTTIQFPEQIVDTSQSFVLVIDRSLQGNDWIEAKNQAVVLIQQAFSQPNTRVGVVIAGGEVLSDGILYDATFQPQLESLVSQLTPDQGLYLDEAISQAGSMLENSDATTKSIVLLSNLNATYSRKVDSVQTTVVCSSRHLSQQWSYRVNTKQPVLRVGDGDTTGLTGNQVTVAPSVCNLNGTHQWRDISYYPPNHLEPAIYEASYQKQQGISVVCSLFGEVSAEQADFAQQIQTNGVFYDTDSLCEGLGLSNTTEPVFFQGILTDTFSDFIQVLPQTVTNSPGTQVTFQNNELIWEVGEQNQVQLSYRVRIDSENNQFDFLETYPLTQNSVFEYQTQSQETVVLEEVLLPVNYAQIFYSFALCDLEGNWITPQGKPTQNPAQGTILEQPLTWENPKGENKWPLGQQVFVSPSTSMLPEGYQFWSEEYSSQSIFAGETSEIIYFPVVMNELSYTVEYFLEDQTYPFDTQTFFASYGDLLADSPDSTKLPMGYHRIPNLSEPERLYQNDKIFQVFYEKDEVVELPYRVEIYLDGVLLTQWEDSTPKDKSLVVFSEMEQYNQYQLQTISCGEEKHSNRLEVAITEDYPTIRYDYVTPQVEDLSYTISYYLGDTLHEQKEVSVSPDNSYFLFQPSEHRYPGYSLQNIQFNMHSDSSSLWIQITEEHNQITVVYQQDNSQVYDYIEEIWKDNILYSRQTKYVWQGNPFISLTYDTIVQEGYQLVQAQLNGNLVQQNVEISNDTPVLTVFFEKSPEPVTYQIDYYKDGALEESEFLSGVAGDKINISVISSRYEGYVYEKYYLNNQDYFHSNIQFTLQSSGNIISIYYLLDPNTKIPYQLQYYYNGVLDESATINHWVTASQTDNFMGQENPKQGYQLKKTEPELPMTLQSDSIIRYYYTKEYYEYSVEYYFDGVLSSGDTKHLKVSANNPVVNPLNYTNDFAGYLFSYVEFDGEGYQVDDTHHIFRLYYESIFPEQEQWDYYVEYFYDDVIDSSQTQLFSVAQDNPVVNVVPSGMKEGFELLSISPELPCILS